MNINDINPYIRFADIVNFTSRGNQVYGKDCRIFYILKGEVQITVNNEEFTLYENSVFYCNAFIVYKIKSAKAQILSLNFDLDQAKSNNTQIYNPISSLENANILAPKVVENSQFLSKYLYIEDGSLYKKELFDIIEEYTKKKLYYKELSSAKLKNIIVKIHRNSFIIKNNSNKAIEKVLSYISNNYNQNITNRQLAMLVGYHEYHLNRIFVKTTGNSIRQYIINIRIDEAKRLLINTDLQISVIAEQVGFENNTYFSSYFKKYTNYTPYNFRKKFKSNI